MKRENGIFCKIIFISLVIVVSAETVGNLGYTVEKFNNGHGLYYENMGNMNLYNAQWKTVIYFDIKKIDLELETLKQYVQHTEQLCRSPVLATWKDCIQFNRDTEPKMMLLTKSRDILKGLTGIKGEKSRGKRGVFNFVGELSKILFGTMDVDDAKYYNEQIENFEQNSHSMSKLIKDQVTIVRATLGTINDTVADMTYNSKLVSEGLIKLKDAVNEIKKDQASNFQYWNEKMTMEGHIVRIGDAIMYIHRNLDILMSSIMNAQKGILQPQLISPMKVIDT